jgi:hypothetical protein
MNRNFIAVAEGVPTGMKALVDEDDRGLFFLRSAIICPRVFGTLVSANAASGSANASCMFRVAIEFSSWLRIMRVIFYMAGESESFDTVAFITTLEFLDEPQLALQEAARVARREIILLWLNPFSVAALRRMRTPGPLLSQVRPLTAREVRMMLLGCGAGRVDGISWASALFPWPFSRLCARIPLGDVLAMKLSLTPSARGEGSGGR